jgi:hypothetical protein
LIIDFLKLEYGKLLSEKEELVASSDRLQNAYIARGEKLREGNILAYQKDHLVLLILPKLLFVPL